MVQWFVGKKQEPNLIEANVSWEPGACGCLDGRRREGPILVRQRRQGSAAEAGVTSAALRLPDARNAYLPIKHDGAKQPPNEMALKEVDKKFFDPRRGDHY